jgi:nitrite reductase/ring-hydroxylating ferredoxin subunit
MMDKDTQEVLTRFGRGTPMGELMREYWAPVARSAALEPDGAPFRFRLLGQNFIAWRSSDGRAVVFDEACPHRGASLALARNEDNALRCIFHGWKIDPTGKVLETPCEAADRREAFAASVRARSYPVREAGKLVWTYIGDRKEPPPFPHFDFMDLPDDRIEVRRAIVPYSWLQGMEAHLDSAHLGILHSSSASGSGFASASRDIQLAGAHAPAIEMDITSYGMREGAVRDLPDGSRYVRVRQVVFPYYIFIPFGPDAPRSWRATVPVDDTANAEWYMLYDMKRPLAQKYCDEQWAGDSGDPDNFAANLGDISNMWHQDRAAMKQGHFSGLTRNVPFEDFVVQASMGAIADRSREYLAPSDTIIAQARRMLHQAALAHQRGEAPPWLSSDIDYRSIHALAIILGHNESWREVVMRPDPLGATA